MKNLSNKDFKFFVDSTYKINLENLKLYIDSFSIFCTALLSHEDSEILSELNYYLKTIWKFIPSKIT